MYQRIDGGRKELIYNAYECWTPPLPKKSEILFVDLPRKEQYWRRQPMPDWYIEKEAEEYERRLEEQHLVDSGRLKAVTFIDPACERYRRQEWMRRFYGVWFMNDGEPTYITGHHYFYLQWTHWDHKDNDGYPFYYEHSRKSFYFRQYCEEDPHCLGYMIIGPRGCGKSNEELACIINNVTRKHHHRAALQSKSFEDDVLKVLWESKVVPLINHLPRFFKPVTSSGSNPANAYNFRRQSVKGSKLRSIQYGPDHELYSALYAVRPGEKELDSATLGEIFEDEIGKTDPNVANIYVRHSVNLKVVFRNHRKVGLLRKTSTVEEMDQGGAEAAKLWKESNPRNRDLNGQTVSKIYRYFISALETDTSPEVCDVHGRVSRDKAYTKIMNERAAYKHDLQKLSQEMRKNPINEEEAFMTDQSRSLFNVFVITERLAELYERQTPLYVKGNFYWVTGSIGDVDFEPDPHAGRWLVRKLLDPKPKDGPRMGVFANNYKMELGSDGKMIYSPLNGRFFRFGGDPIKYSYTEDPRASKAAMHGLELYNPIIDSGRPVEKWETHNFITEYENRPDEPSQSYEDALMQCLYYGAPILFETNLKEIVKHFRERGCDAFLIYRRDFSDDFISGAQDDAGLSSNQEVIDAYVRRLIPHINKHGRRCPFERTLESWKVFDAKKTTRHHLTVSSGYALLATEAVIEDEVVSVDVREWFDGYYQTQ